MFRIKKDDYNTIQFLPDCKSAGRSNRSTRYQKPAPPVKTKVPRAKTKRSSGANRTETPSVPVVRKGLLIVLIVLIIVAAGSWCGYSHFFSPKAKFIHAFNSGDYKTSEKIATENKDDPKFKKAIRSTVKDEVDDVIKRYMGGKLIAVKTLKALDNCDDGSAKMFAKYVQENRVWVDTVETIYYLSDLAATEAKNENYETAMNELYEVEKLAKENGLILDSRITDVLRNYLSGLKPYLFVEFSNTIRYESDYSSITTACDFINRYIQDDDFNSYPETVQKVVDGSCTKLAAAREARTIAKDAGADIEVNAGSGKAPASESKKSSSSSSSSSSSKSSSGSSSRSNSDDDD